MLSSKPISKKIISICGSCLIIFCILVADSCRKPEVLEEENFNEWLSGGGQTVFETGSGAFSSAFPILSESNSAIHDVGDATFEKTFISTPAPINQGLGPVFNSVSCSSCHIGDGRGKPPLPGEQMISMFFFIKCGRNGCSRCPT